MSWLDISTYVVQNCGGLLAGAAGGFIVGLWLAVVVGLDRHGNTKNGAIFVAIWLTTLLAGTIIFGTIGLMPTHDRILAVKIARIKDEAVTEKNLRQGIDVIQRISHKLECKYLGCKGEEK